MTRQRRSPRENLLKGACAENDRAQQGGTGMILFPSWSKRESESEERKPPSRSFKGLPSTEFAFRLFEELKPGEKNLAICPYGARICLSMVWEGASGETRREIAKGLGLEELPDSLANRYERLGRPLSFHKDAERLGLELLTANSLWCDQGFTPKEAYAATLRNEYSAQIQAPDFRAAESAAIVNRWASEKTRGRIPAVVESLERMSPLVTLNAVYFKGLWGIPFRAEFTKEEEFTLLDGTRQMVPMMRQSGEYRYAERGGAQIVKLPYMGSMSMRVVLPAKGTDFKKFCAELRNTLGTDWTMRMGERDGHVRLPRFRMETTVSLNEPLKTMGMTQAFDPGRAELERINDRKPLYVAEVQQKDFVEVNEKGTEAAAVTTTVLDAAAACPPEPPPPFEMIVDRPFVFAITDDLRGTVIFLGAVVDPLESGPATAG